MSAKKFSMQSVIVRLAALAVLVLNVQMAHGFALLGPFEAYQTAAIGYNWDIYFLTPGNVVGYGNPGGPHNLAEEYRRNTPVMYYAFDANFLEYFGSNGVAAVDSAFTIMNSLTNVSMYTPDLVEFPLEAQRINPLAQNMALTDLKSMTLHVLVQQMGLAEPDHYTWTLRDRSMGTPCPDAGLYVVIMRNFGVTTSSLQGSPYSAYVNGVLYSYGIVEECTGPLLAYTDPFAVDPNAVTSTAIAAEPAWIGVSDGTLANLNVVGVGLHIGGYYNYLTRDDVAGLRYLLSKDNYNVESSGPNTVQFLTNSQPVAITNLFDLGLLAAQQATNSAAQLQALYPGLIVNDVSNWFGVGYTTNISVVVTSAPTAPAGYQRTILVTNIEPYLATFYQHTFDNIVTNSVSSTTVYRFQTISPGSSPFGPAGSGPTLRTNTSKPIFINAISGNFFVLPTNTCAVKVLATLFTNVVITTNTISSTTNAVGTGTGSGTGTGTGTGGSVSNQTYIVNTITYFTNNWIVYQPVTCPQDTVARRQGIERIQFVRRDFDSLVGTFWEPATNTYTMVELTNSTLHPQLFQRTVTQPDFLFTADDLPTVGNLIGTMVRSPMNFNQVVSNGLSGPGTIESPSTFTLNKLGPFFYNEYLPNFGNGLFVSDQSSAISGLLWASFDGTTNDPVIYPDGTSLSNLVNQLVMQIQPTSLPDGRNGVPYSFSYTNTVSGTVYTNTLSVTGGQAPYVWSLVSSSLPSGLSLSSTGTISGTPSAPIVIPATYDFVVRVTDAGGRYVDLPLSITIMP
jgi:hypothetical protein